MAKVHLTQNRVNLAKYEAPRPGEAYYLWDDAPAGFGVRIYPSGRKAYVIRYKAPKGRWRTYVLADSTHATLHQARELAQEQLYGVLRGEDPAEKRREELKAVTVREVCQRYMEQYAPRKRSARDDRSRIDAYILPELGSRRLDDVRRPDVAGIHDRIGREAPQTANRVLSLISVLYKQAEIWGLLPDGYQNPAKGIAKLPEKKRERLLSRDEAVRLFQALDAEEDIRFRCLIRLYLYTSTRQQELLGLLWEDVDFTTGRLRFRETKAGRDHCIKPGATAIDILRQLSEFREPGNPYVFPGRKTGDHLQEIKGPWTRVRERAGLPDVHLHDLRRTASTWMVGGGASPFEVRQVLNHSSMTALDHYVHMTGENTTKPLAILANQLDGVEKEAKDAPAVAQDDSPRRSKRESETNAEQAEGGR